MSASKKKLIACFVAFVTVIILSAACAFAATATPTASNVLVDGKKIAFDAYSINDNNYFKLRDLAFVLNGTAKQFEVGYDEKNNAIALTSGKPYTVAGGEMSGKNQGGGGAGAGAKTAAPSDARIFLNGLEVQFTAYKIDDYNYFKLRDVGAAFDFGVDWDGAQDTIAINTSKGYTQEGEVEGGVVGVWRFEGDEDVEILILNADDTFEMGIYYKDGKGVIVEGEYIIAKGLLTMTNVLANGKKTDKDIDYTFEQDGDTVLLDGFKFMRVPNNLAVAVLSSPLAPYPPA